MSYLLETLGRGLLGRLLNAFERQLPAPGESLETLAKRRREACTSFDLTIRAGSACLREARLGDARQAFEQARTLKGAAHLPALGLACVHDELGQLDQALNCLQEAFHHEPREAAISFGIGLCQEQLGRPAEAADSYKNAIDLCPYLRNAYERLGALAVREGRWDAARERYQKLAEMETGDLDVLLPLANLQLQDGRAAEAAETFQRALLIEPEAADEGMDETAEFEDDDRLAQAINTVEKLVDKYPGVTEFHVHLADLYVKAGDDDAAIAQYEAALDLHPSFLEATVKLGTQHLRRQRYDAAAQAFNRAVELNDRLLTAFIGLGVAQHAAGQELDAQATFDLAASLAPNSTLLFSETNRLHLKAMRQRCGGGALAVETISEPGHDELLIESLRRHEQILAIHRCRADLHYRHGMLLRQVGHYEPATQAFQEAVVINPCYAKAWIKLGITWRELDERENALTAFTQALRPDPRQIEPHYQLGLLYAQYNHFDMALERFETIMTGREGAIDFRHNLALTLQNIGMVDRADATWHSICELTRGQGAGLGVDRISALRDAWRP
jgi:tetratricopeptide (TPR) repeat protein